MHIEYQVKKMRCKKVQLIVSIKDVTKIKKLEKRGYQIVRIEETNEDDIETNYLVLTERI